MCHIVFSFANKHGWEEHCVELNVVFANKVINLGIFVKPQIFVFLLGQFLGDGDVADWGIKPYIENFVLISFERNRKAPLDIS